MKTILLFLVLSFIKNSFALFNDKVIEPFLGPYKISQNETTNCPPKLSLMAMCTLSQLDLKHTDYLDFDFIKFKGINEGIMITRIKDVMIEKNETTFKNLKLVSKGKSYQKRYERWFQSEIQLTFKKKKFHLIKFHRSDKNQELKITLDCKYEFDEIENEKILNIFNDVTNTKK